VGTWTDGSTSRTSVYGPCRHQTPTSRGLHDIRWFFAFHRMRTGPAAPHGGRVEAPRLLDERQHPLRLLGRDPPGVVGAHQHAGRRRGQHQGLRPVGTGRSEQDRRLPRLAAPQQRRTLRTHGAHHGQGVVRPLLPLGQRLQRHMARCADPASVDHDETAEGGQPAEEPGERRVLPAGVEGATDLRGPGQVDGSVTDHLVGDPVLAQLGEPDRRYVHGGTVPTGKASRRFVAAQEGR